ncbi:hypothetical protein [Mycolicibacterium houstonense]|uniref:hypothetical protein n=1 Tax=Mycolicibacterium houstonense TaxID=146021 RepID=UPI003F9A78F0
MTDPTYVDLADLPADTLIQRADEITLALTAAPDGSGQLVPQLVIAAIEREWHSEVASAARSNALRAALTGDEAIRLVADKILDRLASGSAAWSALRSGIAVSQREHFEAAIDLLQVAGHIEVADTSRGKAVRLRQP